MVLTLDGISNPGRNVLELNNLELLRRDGDTKVSEGKAFKANTKYFGDRLGKLFVTPGRDINCIFKKVWFLPREVFINIETTKAISSIFSSGFNN